MFHLLPDLNPEAMDSQKTKYQIITTTLAGTRDSAIIDVATDKLFKTVDKIFLYGGTGFSVSTNKNVALTDGLYINNREVFPSLFDGALLFPYPGHEKFTDEINAEAGGSQFKCKVTDTGNGGVAYTVTFILVLKDRV